MTGINASKIIQNLQIVNSFRYANPVACERKPFGFRSFSLFSLSAFPIWISELGPVQTGSPPPGRGGGWESESSRVFNTRQESGNGTRELRTGS
jgi:hypothetical protein